MIFLISIILFVIFILLSGLHFYWVFGGKFGTEVVFPTNNEHEKPKMPGKIPTIIVAFGLLLMGIIILLNIGVLDFLIPSFIINYGIWFIAFIFTIRAIGEFKYVGFFKKIKQTQFAKYDSLIYSPISLMIGILTFLIIIYK